LRAARRSDATGRPVSDIDDAWAAAANGVPVAVKPQDGNGQGVTVNITLQVRWRPTSLPWSMAL
jgi:cyanophycin synthetase